MLPMRIVRIMTSTELIRELLAAGWTLDRVRGSHHVFRHRERPGHVTVPHPKKDLGNGLVVAIRKQAGLEK
jgi:predicted RNA binding protein YcfA (HicA-like mRNA interferase family)